MYTQKSKGGAKDIDQLLGYLLSNQEAWCSVPIYECNLNTEEVEKEG